MAKDNIMFLDENEGATTAPADETQAAAPADAEGTPTAPTGEAAAA